MEFKSLPSGLHAVKEDLVFFLHGAHAGVSAFVQEEADARHRNASFVAVGALVPSGYGQLGRSWTHAEELRSMGKDAVKNTAHMDALEAFWETHRADNSAGSLPAPLLANRDNGGIEHQARRKRAASETTMGLHTDGAWPSDHPALQVPAMLETFGPLLFPLHRAALSRSRILLLGSPSVQNNTNLVYMASVLSSITRELAESLPTEAEPIFRSSPLFSIGIHDIPDLTKRTGDNGGWIATTTDGILGDKKNLYDLLVRLPPQAASSWSWPELRTATGRVVKASQRDLQRWNLLRREMGRLRRQAVTAFVDESPTTNENDRRPLLERRNTSRDDVNDVEFLDRDSTDVVEPPTWSAMAYRGFMWWASAGDVTAWENDDAKADEELLFDMPDIGGILAEESGLRGESEYARAAATLLVAYFRNVTESILRPMASIVEAADDDTEEGVEENEIPFGSSDLRAMGLDSWSEPDRLFVKDMMQTWFHRDAVIVDNGVRVCGMRVF